MRLKKLPHLLLSLLRSFFGGRKNLTFDTINSNENLDKAEEKKGGANKDRQNPIIVHLATYDGLLFPRGKF
jgi:hypothetical protein